MHFPGWAVQAQGGAGMGVDFNQSGMVESCLFQAKRLAARSSTHLKGSQGHLS